MKIGTSDTDQRVLVVAEIGNNHEGRMDVARELVQRAAECRVDAVKFQTFRTEHYVSRIDLTRFARLKSLELSPDQFNELAELARGAGLLFLSTPFDLASVAALRPLVDAYKIASGDVTFIPLLEAVAATDKPIVMSSGASTIDELVDAVAVVRRRGSPLTRDGLAVLHCVSGYPTPPEEANLLAIRAIAEACDATPGYSDHVVGIDAAVVAVAVGARIIEKHFTLDTRFSDFRDHQLSADPAEMRELVGRIRKLEKMLGSGEKQIQPSEAGNRDAIRRSIVMAADRAAGHRIGDGDVTWVRPAGGLAPGHEQTVVGRRLLRNLRAGEAVMPGDIE